MGQAARGKPKALVPIAGRPLATWQIRLLVRAGVERVLVSCAAGTGALFANELSGLGAEIVPVEEPEPLGRGGGLRYAARARREQGDVYALNGDDILDVDLAALLTRHRETGAAVTIAVAAPALPFEVVELGANDVVLGFRQAPRLPYWASCGAYVFTEEGLARLPERGDHETSTFPELAAEGRMRALRHHGLWLTVNTPDELRRAEEHLTAPRAPVA